MWKYSSGLNLSSELFKSVKKPGSDYVGEASEVGCSGEGFSALRVRSKLL